MVVILRRLRKHFGHESVTSGQEGYSKIADMYHGIDGGWTCHRPHSLQRVLKKVPLQDGFHRCGKCALAGVVCGGVDCGIYIIVVVSMCAVVAMIYASKLCRRSQRCVRNGGKADAQTVCVHMPLNRLVTGTVLMGSENSSVVAGSF